jgi:hypothetical protein
MRDFNALVDGKLAYGCYVLDFNECELLDRDWQLVGRECVVWCKTTKASFRCTRYAVSEYIFQNAA